MSDLDRYQTPMLYGSPDEEHDLVLLFAGSEECRAGHSWAGVRDYHLLHLVLRGRGQFSADGRDYALAANSGFLIVPDQLVSYRADTRLPWSYQWLAFTGRASGRILEGLGITREAPLFAFSAVREIVQLVDELERMARFGFSRDLYRLGRLYHFFYLLSRDNAPLRADDDASAPQDIYVRQALRYIRTHFSRKMTIAGLADYLGIDRKYFSSLFRKAMGVSPREYLIAFRIARAQRLLELPRLTIASVANSVGYSDQLQFSRVFHARTGFSPSAYRRKSLDGALLDGCSE